MNHDLFASELFRVGPLVITDTLVTSVLLSLALVVGAVLLARFPRIRPVLEMGYETLEFTVQQMATVDVRPLVPLILTLWLFLAIANLVGLVPLLTTPTRDLSVTVALAAISFLAGHIYAFRTCGVSYLRGYLEPHPLLLPFNLIGELTRTAALALRLFGNMLSGHLVAAILLYLVGFLVPVPLMLLSVITGVVQAYIFGVLTLVFAVSSLEVATQDSSASASQRGTKKASKRVGGATGYSSVGGQPAVSLEVGQKRREQSA